MITISSKAGQRLARAKAELDKVSRTTADSKEFYRILSEYDAAAFDVAEELIAGKHHLVEGD